MKFVFLVLIFCSLFVSINSTIGPSNKKTATKSTEKNQKKSQDNKENVPPGLNRAPPTGSPPKPAEPSEQNVFERNLIQEELTTTSILENHRSYCSTCLNKRRFNLPTMFYVTPWNSRGFQIVELFAEKIDFVSPVWFQVRPSDEGKFQIDGEDSINRPWIEKVREKNPKVQFVPRVIFENWPKEQIEKLFRFENEKVALAATLRDFLVKHDDLFDGLLIEVLMQFRSIPKAPFRHVMNDICEQIHSIETNRSKKLVFLAVPPYDEIFDENDFRSLSSTIDGFSLMTYDFPNREPGPVAPFGKFFFDWIESEQNEILWQ